MTGLTELITGFQVDYVRTLNAVLASVDYGSADAHRWRGHAEAYRQACTKLRAAAGMAPVDMTSTEWRTAHGVYTAEDVAGFRRRRAPGTPEPDPALIDQLLTMWGEASVEACETVRAALPDLGYALDDAAGLS